MTRRPATASLVVLAFGPDRVIERAVQSLARQTATDLEIVVVHDRANNAFLQRQVGTLADRYPTTFVVAAGSGPGARRQVGVQASHGRYFAIVDGAESFGATYFERACLALDEMPDAGFATTWGGFTPEDAKLDARVDLADLTASPWTVANATLVRRSSLDAAGGFDPSLPDFVEWDLLLTLAERGERGVLVPGAMLHRHPQDDVRLRESLRGERHLPAVRRIFDRHVASFERHAARALSQRDGNAKALWKSRGLDLVARRERLRTELDGVMNDLASVRGELKRYGRATLEWNDLRRATPLSRNWGLERGRPIDRHYIEGFVSEHAADIRGAVLEVLDSGLTEAYGGSRVRRSDVLDIDPGNHRATVIGDLRTAGQLPANAYDCFILTQTLHLVDDIEAAVVQAHRALKPGGVLLATLPCVSMVAEEYGAAGDHWRVTEAGARQLFERVFSPAMVQTRSRGNVLAATAFLYGLSCEEIELGELDADDPAYPLIVTVRAVKSAAASVLTLSSRQQRGALILLYHQIASRSHDLHGIAVSPDEFRAQVEHLCRHWRPMALTALAEAAAGGELPERAVALTFDDGYVDNLECAARILAEFEVPATFFLTSECLNQQRTFWWDALEHILLESDRLPSSVTLRIDGGHRTFGTADVRQRRAAHDLLYPHFKASLPVVRDDLLRQLSTFNGSKTASTADRPMTADEIRALAAFPLVEIGAHGVHHVTLSGLAPEHLHREIFESRSELERLTSRSVDLFAYPFGDMSPEAIEMVRAADYRFAVGCDPRPLRTREHPHRLPRLEPPHGGTAGFIDWLARQTQLTEGPNV